MTEKKDVQEKPRSYFLPGLSVAVLILAIDQISKYILLEMVGMPSRRFIEVLPFFNLAMVWNKGVSFGMFAGEGMQLAAFLIILTSLIVLLLIEWLRRARDYATAMALATIIGGAAGNIVDRLRFGAVADFFDFHLLGYHWPAFNVADAAIFLGVAGLLLQGIFTSRKSPPIP